MEPRVDALWARWTRTPCQPSWCKAIDPARGATSTLVRIDDGSRHAVAKLAGDALDPIRSMREQAVLAAAPAACMPRCLSAVEGPWGIDLLLEHVGDTDGDVGAEPCTELFVQVLHALGAVHAVPLESLAHADLPAWGTGTASVRRPHQRRARRLQRRWPLSVEAWGLPADRPCLAASAERVLDALEADMDHLAGQPRVLVHGDVHADNIRLGADQVWLLDWQTASTGPAVVDLAMWFAAQWTPDLHEQHLAHLGAVDLPALAAALRVCFGGLLMGYATRTPDSTPVRESIATHRAFSRTGFAGLVLHMDEVLGTLPR